MQLDNSAGKQEFLHIEYSYNEQLREAHEYTISVKDPGEKPLYSLFSTCIVDRTSLVILVAQAIAKDPLFCFGRDQLAYRWAGTRWLNVDKWLRALDFSMHAYAHTGHQAKDGGSITALTLAAWRAQPTSPLEGQDLKPFGRYRGIPFDDCVVTDLGPNRQHETTQHRPENMNTRVLPTTYRAAADGLAAINSGAADDSILMRFLRSSLDEVQIELVQNWFGYHLLTTVIPNAEKMLYMWGSGGNGKGQILWLIRGLVGADSCAELRLSDLKIDANLELLKGALAMIGGEASTKTEVERLKALVSREPLTCNPKYRDPFMFTPECLVTQASNWAPSFDDKSDALVRRIISLELKNSFKDVGAKIEDIAHEVVANEYSLLAGFALGGVFKIMQTGRFTVPEGIEASSALTVAAGNPYEAFAERIEYGAYEVSENELYAVYKRWCLDENGSGRESTVDSKREFFINIKKVAIKAKSEVKSGHRSNAYLLSRWIDRNGNHVLVCPELEGTKRPLTIQGLRVLDSADRVIGQDIPPRLIRVA